MTPPTNHIFISKWRPMRGHSNYKNRIFLEGVWYAYENSNIETV